MSKIALISGITGQDGSFLAEFLIDKGYDCLLYTSDTAKTLLSTIQDGLPLNADIAADVAHAMKQWAVSYTHLFPTNSPPEENTESP